MPHNHCADNIRRDFAKGAHVVMARLLSAFRDVIFVHNESPASDMPHDLCADSVVSESANGAHVVIAALLFAFRYVMCVHVRNP